MSHCRGHLGVQERADRVSTTAFLGGDVLTRCNGGQAVLHDHWVLVEGIRIAAVTLSRPAADQIFDRPGRFVLARLLNMHNHRISEAVARAHTEDGNGRSATKRIVCTVLMPLTRRGIGILSPAERLGVARMGCCKRAGHQHGRRGGDQAELGLAGSARCSSPAALAQEHGMAPIESLGPLHDRLPVRVRRCC